MCGIVALISIDGKPLDDALGEEQVEGKLDESLERIKHRGPDGKGIWISKERDVGELLLMIALAGDALS